MCKGALVWTGRRANQRILLARMLLERLFAVQWAMDFWPDDRFRQKDGGRRDDARNCQSRMCDANQSRAKRHPTRTQRPTSNKEKYLLAARIWVLQNGMGRTDDPGERGKQNAKRRGRLCYR